MNLGNMRQNGVRTLAIHCGGRWCNHEAILDVGGYADDVAVPEFGPRMVCTVCGAIGAGEAKLERASTGLLVWVRTLADSLIIVPTQMKAPAEGDSGRGLRTLGDKVSRREPSVFNLRAPSDITVTPFSDCDGWCAAIVRYCFFLAAPGPRACASVRNL
jgi:hypothetical protein